MALIDKEDENTGDWVPNPRDAVKHCHNPCCDPCSHFSAVLEALAAAHCQPAHFLPMNDALALNNSKLKKGPTNYQEAQPNTSWN